MPKRTKILFALIFTALALVNMAKADTNILTTNNSYSSIGEYTFTRLEAAQPLSIEQARMAFIEGKFSTLNKSIASFGIGSRPVWLTFGVENNLDRPAPRRLAIENSWLDKADVYVIHEGQVVAQQQMGDSYPFNARPVDHRFFVFDHDYAKGLSQVFIRSETPDPMMLPIFFGYQNDYDYRDVFNGYSYGLLYGIILALLLYNTILYLRLRLARYLFYVVYLAAFIMTNLTYTGHGYSFFWPENNYWQHWAHPFFISVFGLAGIAFAFSFLKTRQLFPGVFKNVIWLCIAFCFSEILFFQMEMQTLAVAVSIGFIIFFTIFVLILAVYSVRQIQEAVYFVVAATAGLTGSLVTALTVWGLVPYYEWTYRATEIGLAIEAILLSIALTEQFRLVQNQKVYAEKMARHDPLTNLLNRRGFDEIVAHLLSNAQRHKHPLAIIILDIDNFKMINDRYGHDAGDSVIKRVSETIQEVIRLGDISARWGGEEFVLLLPETNAEQAMQLAERLRQKIANLKVQVLTETISITVSLGVAGKKDENSSIDELIKKADDLMYQAKDAGRNMVCAEQFS
ncbi:MAG: sensor domain-containing diguanylate cyclase [Gammaproteobacteria bacterium]|nr:sensor domain-containing diguanylate cyclase [Gammaproteobacteria bacterium]